MTDVISHSDPAPAKSPLRGAGLGLRRSLLSEINEQRPDTINFLEVAPENWINVGGHFRRDFESVLERYPLTCHGLSLSIGSPAPLDLELVRQIRDFIHRHNVVHYSDHLSYCSDDGHLYDLMPIPFTEEAVHYVADRIRVVQDILERRMIIENISYYAAPGQELDEATFINAVLTEADCDLLLDVNNIYVNSINHRYDADTFMQAMPADRVVYFHVAGHYHEAEDLRVDTHAAPVIDPVWELLERAYDHFGPVPTLLERDFNIPPLAELLTEVDRINELQSTRLASPEARAAHG